MLYPVNLQMVVRMHGAFPVHMRRLSFAEKSVCIFAFPSQAPGKQSHAVRMVRGIGRHSHKPTCVFEVRLLRPWRHRLLVCLHLLGG